MDFTINLYIKLLNSLQQDYTFQTFEESIKKPQVRVVILRHDIDRNPQNAINFAKIEHSFGIKGTYYFRVVPESYNLEIMNRIADLGHEIGYHYEDVDLVIKRKLKVNNKNDKDELVDLAYVSFCNNLEMLRENFDIKTICMHGSPRSKFDNKIIWEKYNYKDLGVIGEPYFDINFDEFAYFTDTGRRWNGYKYSIRDKVNSKYDFDLKATQQIINSIDNFPAKIMFSIHPERWNERIIPWTKELVYQNLKNIVKRLIIIGRYN